MRSAIQRIPSHTTISADFVLGFCMSRLGSPGVQKARDLRQALRDVGRDVGKREINRLLSRHASDVLAHDRDTGYWSRKDAATTGLAPPAGLAIFCDFTDSDGFEPHG
ncbi:MAG: hypothetical protein EPO26_17850 [Chloroflexota bacterium]|nr:MAG: hypothetical protein EPO26_17850 [Chloroflexota bacterium]